MKKTLIVTDMQNDFISMALGKPEAEALVPKVKAKIEEYKARGDEIIYTRNTHGDNYLETAEGKKFPTPHCINGTLAVGSSTLPDDLATVLKECFGHMGVIEWGNWEDSLKNWASIPFVFS